jgi:hypothetical protein
MNKPPARLGITYPMRDLSTIIPLMTRRDWRSEWRWFRLANGDLIVGFYPQAEGYESVELADSDDYIHAAQHKRADAITAPWEDIQDPYFKVDRTDPIVELPSGWSWRKSQENGDHVDCTECGNMLNDDFPIAYDSEGYSYHEGCLS